MRLLIVGTLKGQLTTATKIAMDNGASVTHAEDHEQAMRVLRGGKGADLLLVDVALDIRDLVMRLEAEHIHVPIVACGISNDARAAVAAIHAGAKEYIPLPPDPELIAAVLAAVANDSRDMVYRDEAGSADRRLRRLRHGHWRIRHRQGGAGALCSHSLQPRQEAVHIDQLRGNSRAPA
jgi:two-component system response regulator FlrC